RQAVSQSGNIQTSWGLNAAANDFQMLEFYCSVDQMASLQRQTYDRQEGPALNYRLATPVSLESRSDQQMVRIMESQVASRFYHVAIPLLTSHVYREAELTNTTKQDLLGGPVNAYLDNRFMGRTEVATVTRGQMFVVGFGADPQLRAVREMVDRKESTQGGNRLIDVGYRLAIENYKDKPVNVRLLERMPYAQSGDDVQVTLGKLEDPLSKDADYLRTERPKGILRWSLQVPAHASAEKARVVRYGYQLEFDRKFSLSVLGGTKQQKEFEQMQRGRLVK
ncbi:MAG: DUF4139 domain-containing protein, partial [Phycisphaeraceae bacterium]|nr:DUF4139 domain-containing protein [Phycisphaeraceae bacterium]